MSRRSPSASEGEIDSGGEELLKATSTRTKQDNRNINGSTRPVPARSTYPRGPSDVSRDIYYHFRDDDGQVRLPPTRDRSRSRSPYRRDRSRSPYRASKAPRGEKRRREEDHDGGRGGDPRRFKVYHESGEARGNDHRSRRPYDELDRPQAPMLQSRYDDRAGSERGRGQLHNRPREEKDRSRSPYRANKADRPLERRDVRGSRSDHHVQGKGGHSGGQDERQGLHNSFTQGSNIDRGRPDSRQSMSSRESTPKPSFAQDRSTEIRMNIPQKSSAESKDEKNGSDAAATTTVEEQPLRSGHGNNGLLTEDQLIEQRRKRREELKKKHAQSTPLLVQTLEHNMMSAPDTPAHDSSSKTSEHSPPSSAGSPATPQLDSAPGSPADFVMNDDDLANHHQIDTTIQDEGPSAADYDPSMDMQEDREKKLHQEEAEAAGASEAVGAEDRLQPQPEAKPKKEYDMFADDDDDDDMFAPDDKQPQSGTGGRQARALDQSLLDNWDYPDGHYRIILGELLDGRYAVKSQLGKGTFATVVGCTDIKTNQDVAVKIACNNDTMRKAGTKEMDILRFLNQNDLEDKKHIIRFERQFEHKGHNCLVFEHLNADLREVLKKFGRNVGINLFPIKSFARQMFLALSHMKKYKVLHADLKPDNILMNKSRNVLKVCDFGTASLADDAEITPYLVSRFYRAPEIIMGMKYDYAIDMWSIGCTLFELYTGRILFTGADNNQMLRAIMECRGKFTMRMLKRSELAFNHFDEHANFLSREKDKTTGQTRVKQMTFSSKALPGKDLKTRLSANAKTLAPADLKQLALFTDLLDKCLQVDPEKRISPNDALRHGFIAAHSATTATTAPAIGFMRR